jgi:23S rRNA (adenine2503-C2)-methyltransferase
MTSLIGATTAELSVIAKALGEPEYRGRQIAAWVYKKNVENIAAMSDLAICFRNRLAEEYDLGLPETVHKNTADDGTIKYLLRSIDGQTVESVYLPYTERVSACLSSQVGCAAGCTFCATAQGGFARNLTAGEIVGQFLRMQKDNERRISHVVYMGMGEPLWNYEALVQSIRILGHEVGLSYRHITVSTVGVVPGIRALAAEALPITLALSLHAPDDETRQRMIPTARKWKLDEILDACAYYTRRTQRDLTFEYLLIGGVNDHVEQAGALAALLNQHKLPGNVNLIPFNYVETSQGFRKPSRESIAAFRAELQRNGRVTTQRMTRGNSVSAACGQLRRGLSSPVARVHVPNVMGGTT